MKFNLHKTKMKNKTEMPNRLKTNRFWSYASYQLRKFVDFSRTILIFSLFFIHSFLYHSNACHDFVIAIEFSFLFIVIVLAHAVSHFLIADFFFKFISPQIILNLKMVIHSGKKVFKSFQAFESHPVQSKKKNYNRS